MKEKVIYKKRIFVELVRLHHNFLHTKRNKQKEGYQIYIFEETPELLEDLKMLEKKKHETII
ncbi:hypothetical protein [Neobacillus sp. DY30]|uniref:hypothetical protein n=1 Tax=Neobacillus sp. DY30 TaxID=3047871 RepID=UPI0024BFF731|nr:hypothetical protein [Neobacillus sp. DY30]WHX99301.1 hypothetical protein QNH29_22320 [Neobacillus sp. DY30]